MTATSIVLESNETLEKLHPYVEKVNDHKRYFHRIVQIFDESESNFRPSEELLSVSGQILHVALSIEYFLSGMFGKYEGFGPLSGREYGFVDMNWIELADERNLHLALDPVEWPKSCVASTSIAESMKLFDEAMEKAAEFIGAMSPEEFTAAQLPENPIYDPNFYYPDILELMNDHTAHHRGSLVIYAHLLGKEPRIPYFDMEDVIAYAQELQQRFQSEASPEGAAV